MKLLPKNGNEKDGGWTHARILKRVCTYHQTKRMSNAYCSMLLYTNQYLSYAAWSELHCTVSHVFVIIIISLCYAGQDIEMSYYCYYRGNLYD